MILEAPAGVMAGSDVDTSAYLGSKIREGLALLTMKWWKHFKTTWTLFTIPCSVPAAISRTWSKIFFASILTGYYERCVSTRRDTTQVSDE